MFALETIFSSTERKIEPSTTIHLDNFCNYIEGDILKKHFSKIYFSIFNKRCI
jgi:hypothetical protein